MSDHFPGEITIGGGIPRKLFYQLVEMITSQGVSIDWQYTLDRTAVLIAVEEAVAKGQTVRFTDDEARCGRFEELEEFLMEHEIHFDRQSIARYEYDGEKVFYRGGRKAIVTLASQNGEPLVARCDILKILNTTKSNKIKLKAIRKLIPIVAPLELIRFV